MFSSTFIYLLSADCCYGSVLHRVDPSYPLPYNLCTGICQCRVYFRKENAAWIKFIFLAELSAYVLMKAVPKLCCLITMAKPLTVQNARIIPNAPMIHARSAHI